MRTLRPITLLVLTLMMFSFSSCELVEDMLPVPGIEEPEPEPEAPSPLEMLVTDSATTDLVWQLQQVQLDGADFTAAYDQVYQLQSSYFDIKSDGTFSGALLGETYYDNPAWQAEGQVLTLGHDYMVQALTPTQMVLARQLPADSGFPGDVVTYVFVKE